MATALTLLGAVLAPAATIYISNKVISREAGKEDTINRSLEKTAGTGLAVAFAGWALANYASKGSGSSMYDFGTGMLLGGGVTSGMALGARLTTSKTEGETKVLAKEPAKVAGLPPYYSRMGAYPQQYAPAGQWRG